MIAGQKHADEAENIDQDRARTEPNDSGAQ